MKLLIPFLFSLVTLAARPVSFYHGTSIMGESSDSKSELMGSYTILSWLAPGLHYSELRSTDGTERFGLGMLNALLLRHNGDDWQGNIYFSAGAGQRYYKEKFDFASMGVLSFDAESRRYYIEVKGEEVLSKKDRGYYRIRPGFAPYLADMNGFNGWILLQCDYSTWEKEVNISPTLRFFYQNLLFEIGASFRGKFLLNFATEI